VQLPTVYGQPGFVLLATDHGSAVGCVGLRAMPDGRGEIRRMYLDPTARGSGLGKQLLHRLIADAATNGFTNVVLNTVPTMTAAVSLYQSAGFTPIQRYHLTTTPGVLYFGRETFAPTA
jgi:ribosomal protein S18 acetylase RimI-like enzyme